jgi:hypothetical protein
MDTIMNQTDLEIVSRLEGFDSTFSDTVGLRLRPQDRRIYAAISGRDGPWSFFFGQYPMKPEGVSDEDPNWNARWNIDHELYDTRYSLNEDLRRQAPDWEKCRIECRQLLSYEVEQGRTIDGHEFIRTYKIERVQYGDHQIQNNGSLYCLYQMDSAYFTFGANVRLLDTIMSIQELRMDPVMQKFIRTSESVAWW